MESLVLQPVLNSIFERDCKNITFKEMSTLENEKCYESVDIKTIDGKSWGVPPTSFKSWLSINNYTESDIISMELNIKGWL